MVLIELKEYTFMYTNEKIKIRKHTDPGFNETLMSPLSVRACK